MPGMKVVAQILVLPWRILEGPEQGWNPALGSTDPIGTQLIFGSTTELAKQWKFVLASADMCINWKKIKMNELKMKISAGGVCLQIRMPKEETENLCSSWKAILLSDALCTFATEI